MLADNYIVSSGAIEERSSLHVREGFSKSSSFAFGFLFITIFLSVFKRGLKIQIYSGNIQLLGLLPTTVYAIVSFFVSWLFLNRFIFYNRMKLTNTYLIFLALWNKEKLRSDKKL